MPSIKDDRGYNQGFKQTRALKIRTERRSDYIVSKIRKSKDIKILEIGCGTGELSYLLAKQTNQSVLGTDICIPFIECAKNTYSHPKLEFGLLDFNNIENSKYKDKKFDYIVGNGILHHLFYNLNKTLINFNYLLKDNGEIIFLEPNLSNPYCLFIFRTKLGRKLANLEPTEMAFSEKFISRKLNDNNFKNISVEYRDFLLPITPSFLIKTNSIIGDILERTPLVNKITQSIYINAKKNSKLSIS